MKAKIGTVILALVALSGCSSIQKTALCNAQEREAIVAENERLLKRKEVIDGYLNGGEIPGEMMSFATRKQLEAAYASSYNESVDRLVERSKRFNELCVKKGA